MRFKLIMAFVNPEITSKIVATAKKNGATGDVIIPARGTGLQPAKLFGVTIENKTDIVLLVVEEHIVQKILDSFCEDCNLEESGKGIAIVLSIDKVAGLDRQINSIREKLKEEQL